MHPLVPRATFYLDKVVRLTYKLLLDERKVKPMLRLLRTKFPLDKSQNTCYHYIDQIPNFTNYPRKEEHKISTDVYTCEVVTDQSRALKMLRQTDRTINLFHNKFNLDVDQAPQDELEKYFDALELRKALFDTLGEEEFERLQRLNNNAYMRLKRLYKRLFSMIHPLAVLDEDELNAVFLTFTFTDEALSSTSPDTRRQYVRKWLKAHSDDYVANIDFGSLNGREHYHAVAVFDGKQDLTSWKEGALNCKVIPKTDEGKALAKYIAKLGAHATKESTKRSHLIYSRNLSQGSFDYNPYE